MVHRKSITMIDADLPPRDDGGQGAGGRAHPSAALPGRSRRTSSAFYHAKDLLKAVAFSAVEAIDIGAIMREAWFIPDTTVVKDQLNAFLKRQSHFALVVDEYGALQGLVTLEDILEEIVGEIDDEHDEAIQGVRRQADGWVHVDGDVTVRDLNRAMDWNLPDEHAVTIAGLVIHEARAIPEPGQKFLFHHVTASRSCVGSAIRSPRCASARPLVGDTEA